MRYHHHSHHLYRKLPIMEKQAVADAAAGMSAGIAGFAWLAPLSDFLQVAATLVAIITGVYAIRWHKFRLEQGRAALDRDLRDRQIHDTISELETKIREIEDVKSN